MWQVGELHLSQRPQFLQAPLLMAWEKLESDFPSPGPACPSQRLCVFAGIQWLQHKPSSLGTLGGQRGAEGGKEEVGEVRRGTLGHTCLGPDHKTTPVAYAAQYLPALHRREDEFWGTLQRQSICSSQILSSPVEPHRKVSRGEPTSTGVYRVPSFPSGPLSTGGLKGFCYLPCSTLKKQPS